MTHGANQGVLYLAPCLRECGLFGVVVRLCRYLEPIFSRGALPGEQARFKRVDDEYRDIMGKVRGGRALILLRLSTLPRPPVSAVASIELARFVDPPPYTVCLSGRTSFTRGGHVGVVSFAFPPLARVLGRHRAQAVQHRGHGHVPWSGGHPEDNAGSAGEVRTSCCCCRHLNLRRACPISTAPMTNTHTLEQAVALRA